MQLVHRLRQLLAVPPPDEPAGPPIQEREQEAAKSRLLAYVDSTRNQRVFRYGRWWAP